MSSYAITDRVKGYMDNPPSSKEVLTKFLTLSEQAEALALLKNRSNYQMFGGYEGAEKKRLAMYDQTEFHITCFQIKTNEQFLSLSHQNILGTLLSLSIEVDAIGDIIAEDKIFFVISELKEFIYLNFTAINQVPISLIELVDVKIERSVNLLEDSFSVSSLRLDAIVSKITRQSRDLASKMILDDFIKVNQVISNKATKSITEGDIISIRRFGRFVIQDTSRVSKKGKIIVNYGKYI